MSEDIVLTENNASAQAILNALRTSEAERTSIRVVRSLDKNRTTNTLWKDKVYVNGVLVNVDSITFDMGMTYATEVTLRLNAAVEVVYEDE